MHAQSKVKPCGWITTPRTFVVDRALQKTVRGLELDMRVRKFIVERHEELTYLLIGVCAMLTHCGTGSIQRVGGRAEVMGVPIYLRLMPNRG